MTIPYTGIFTPDKLPDLGISFHFNMETYRAPPDANEWAPADLDPDLFQPTNLDIGQWLQQVVKLGGKYAVLTTKHIDGFCLWPSLTSPHNVSAGSWYTNNGQRDVVKEYVGLCRGFGLQVGFYFCVVDRFYAALASPTLTYTQWTLGLLTELMSNYGQIDFLLLDAWPDLGVSYTDVDFPTIINAIRELQPNCTIAVNNHEHNLAHTDLNIYEYPAELTIPSGAFSRPSAVWNTLWDSGFNYFYFWHPSPDIPVFANANSYLPTFLRWQTNQAKASYLYNLAPNGNGVIDPTEITFLNGFVGREVASVFTHDQFALNTAETAGVLLSAHTSTIDSAAYRLLQNSSATTISINPAGHLIPSNNAGNGAYYASTTVPASADYSALIEIGFNSSSPFASTDTYAVLIRATDNGSGTATGFLIAELRYDGTQHHFDLGYKQVGGTYAPITNSLPLPAGTLSAANVVTIRLSAKGTVVIARFYIDSKLACEIQNNTDFGVPATGLSGLFIGSSSTTTAGGYIRRFESFVEDYVAPSAPVMDYVIGSDSVVYLKWSSAAEDDLSHYYVYRSTDNTTFYSIGRAERGRTTFVDETAANGTTWYYRITAVDASFNESAASNVKSALPATPASLTRGSVTVGMLSTILLDAARNAGLTDTDESVYPLDMRHRAIQGCLDDFIRDTRCTRETDSVTLAASSTSVDLSVLDGFHTERIFDQWAIPVTTPATNCVPDLEITDAKQVLIEQAKSTTRTGPPHKLAFLSTDGTGQVPFPADQTYKTYVEWWPPLVAWTAGDTSDQTTNLIINLPGDLAKAVVRSLGVIKLQENQPEQLESGTIERLQKKYDELVTKTRGAGNLGVKSVQRRSVDEFRRDRRW